MEDPTMKIFKAVDAEASIYDEHEFISFRGFINEQKKEEIREWIVWPQTD